MAVSPAVARKQSQQTSIHDLAKKDDWRSLLAIFSDAQCAHDINARDSDGNTALHIAVAEVRG